MIPEVNFEQPSKSRNSKEEPSRSISSKIALSVKAEQPASSSTSIFLQWNVSTLQDNPFSSIPFKYQLHKDLNSVLSLSKA